MIWLATLNHTLCGKQKYECACDPRSNTKILWHCLEKSCQRPLAYIHVVLLHGNPERTTIRYLSLALLAATCKQ